MVIKWELKCLEGRRDSKLALNNKREDDCLRSGKPFQRRERGLGGFRPFRVSYIRIALTEFQCNLSKR